MLTINDLSMNEELDRAAMRTVLGGMSLQGRPASWFSVLNIPTIETGFQFSGQGEPLGIEQTQNGFAGQTYP